MPLRAPPIDFDAIRTAFADAIMAATGLGQNSVVQLQAEQPIAKRPEVPFAGFMLTGVSQPFGQDEVGYAQQNDPDVWLYKGPRMLTASFQFYGETHEQAYGLACAWQAALGQAPTLERLAQGGLTVWRRNPAQDITALMATGYEGRAALSATFGVLSRSFVNVGTIAQVPLSGLVHAGQAEDAILTTATLGD